MITHVLLFKLKDPATDLDEAVRRLRSLEGNVPVLRSLDIGIDAVRSERSYDIALIGKLDSMDDLATYQDDPFHVEVAVYMRSIGERVAVVDYES